MLFAFFYVMLLGGLRPSEVLALTIDGCELPAHGWGRLTLTGAAPDVGSLWTDSGERHEQKGLKHRATSAVRIVPIPPELVAILRAYLQEFALLLTAGCSTTGRMRGTSVPGTTGTPGSVPGKPL
ncbi:hypothetical protein [Nonomuraea sp. LPB2021202275-12-8]|uniref:hypothetical protein n=1 Tax=Nonomuraea sp. LPB2021202275-12-8 TaxID=3120159 RepID=UPI00300C5CD9